jgi:serine/threonine protein kinase
VGSVLKDRYLLVRELSQGGFGKVFLAHDRQLHDRPVVVKIKLDHAIEDPWFERKFSEELRALALIDHPGVVGILDSGRAQDGKPFLVMQYVEGRTLRSVLTPEGLPLDRVADIVRQIGQALGAAHDKNIWHRDLKPENIMLQTLHGGEEHVKLIDFGIATIAELAGKQTHTRMAGSPAYMAPEQISGHPSAATDIYAFGVIAYEMVTGRKPFVPEDAVQLALLQREGVRVKPSALRPGISSAAEKRILQALSYNPNDRPASASAFGNELSQALLDVRPDTAEMSGVYPGRVRRWGAAGAVALILAIGGVWMYLSRTPPARQEPVKQAGVTPGNDRTPAQMPGLNADDAAVELAFWNSIRDSSDPRLYREYLAKYPQGKFASLAHFKLEAQPSKRNSTPPAVAPDAAVQQRPPQPANVPEPRPALQADDYNGPLRGEVRWAGSLEPGATLTIQAGKATSGNLTGDLPRVPSTVEADTSGVSVVEKPSAANQWDRVVLKNSSSAPVSVVRILWRVAR